MIDLIQQKFESEYFTYIKQIYRYFYFRTSSHETAEDLASSVFSKYWKKLKEGAEIINTKALLYTMAHGVLVDHYRASNHNVSVSIEMIDQSKVAEADETQNALEIDEDIKQLGKFLDLIKEEYKEILVLYYIEELKPSQIAKILNKKEATVRVTIHRALNALRKIYEKK
jgi:RNA polymerase sigma-70 factor (ECF subfamily)